MSHQHGPVADVSVRPSTPEDAPRLGEIQVATWRATLGDQVPAAALDADAFAAAWRTAIASPPSAKHRTLTACDGPLVVGFVALAPAPDDDEAAEVVALEVDPEHARAGHGSRLLAACADILRQTGAARVRTWVTAGDDVREAFLGSAGFAPSGVRRRLDVGDGEVVEHLWGAVL